MYCETFDGTSAGDGSANPKKSKSDRVTTDQEEPDVNKGLCVNCALRETCDHPQPNGGVWHCEDYC